MVQDEEIARILQAEADPEHACIQLVARGNEEGGDDNITVILSCYEAVG
jgi:serine/threonine protein phosphatase PrpC